MRTGLRARRARRNSDPYPQKNKPNTTNSRSDADPQTLTRFILQRQRAHPEASGDFTLVLTALATAFKAISSAVRRAGLLSLLGAQRGGGANASGDVQKKLDVLSNEIMKNLLASTGAVAVMASEEEEGAVVVAGAAGAEGKYAVVFDPLDGSTNIDCNVSVGSIFGVYRRRQDPLRPAAFAAAASAADVLCAGSELVCAGYALYGSSTQLCVALAEDAPDARGASLFTLDALVGEFLLTQAALRVPAAPQRIFSLNAGGLRSMPRFVRRFVDECQEAAPPWSLRYVGSFVADAHRTLVYGGVFLYPGTAAAPKGKLRLVYEAAPLALIFEVCGGRAIAACGSTAVRLLELKPASLHERVPVIVGCARDVTRLEELMALEVDGGDGVELAPTALANTFAAALVAGGGKSGPEAAATSADADVAAARLASASLALEDKHKGGAAGGRGRNSGGGGGDGGGSGGGGGGAK